MRCHTIEKLIWHVGKIPTGPAQRVLQPGPQKALPRVFFSARCDVLMAGHMLNGVLNGQGGTQAGQGFVLRRFECLTFQSFELDADRVIVALFPSAVARHASMPGAIVTADELQQLPSATNEKMGGNLQTADLLEVGVGIPIQGIGEQGLHLGATILTRWQADRVQHHQVDVRSLRTRAEIRRIQTPGEAIPTLVPKGRRRG